MREREEITMQNDEMNRTSEGDDMDGDDEDEEESD